MCLLAFFKLKISCRFAGTGRFLLVSVRVSRLLFWFAMQKKGAVPASLISCNVVDIFINKVMSWFALGFADIPADKGLGFGLCTLKVPDMSQRVFPACQRIPVGSK